MGEIVLNNKTIISGSAGLAEGFLWLWFTGYTFAQVYSIFTDANKTGSIVFNYGEQSKTYEGYTDLRVISFDAGDNVSICLRKGNNNA